MDNSTTSRMFTFGGQRKTSLGSITIKIPTLDGCFLPFKVDIVNLNIPLLIGLEFLDKHKLVVDTVRNQLVCEDQGWTLPLVRKLGHIYLEWQTELLYTSTQLQKIHKHFFHPTADRIFNLMKRAEDPDATPETLKELENVTDACDICQRLAQEPGRFRVSLPPADIVFNRIVLVDLMTLEGDPVLHLIDKDTLFNAAAFLFNGESTDEVWKAYLKHWVNPYVGYSDEIHDDQGPQFQSVKWKNLLQSAGIKRTDSGVESHNALGVGERYHSFLRQIFRKVRAESPTLSKDEALSLAVNAMNSTAGPQGLSPTLLVFGIVPRIPIRPTQLPEQRERMKALQSARNEMVKHVAKSRLSTAVRSNVPRAAKNDIRAGMNVLFYREKPVNQWTGPFKVISCDGKQVWLNLDGRTVLASVDKVKMYKEHVMHVTDGDEVEVVHSPSSTQIPVPDVVDAIISADVFLSKFHSRLSNFTQATEREGEGLLARGDVYLTEILKPGDKRMCSSSFRQAKRNEVAGLRNRGTWTVVKTASLPKDANILGGRFVCTLKNVGSEREQAKARYVAQGQKDKEKPFIVHNISTLRQSSTKIIVSTSAVRGFRVFSHDVKQAYLQSKDGLTRKIYLKPKAEDREYFEIDDGETLFLLKPLYGVCDAGDYWGVTVIAHIEGELKMISLAGDPSLYMKECEKGCTGMLGAYVDDCLLAGDESFQKLTELMLRKFDSRPREWDTVEFLGVKIETIEGKYRSFEISQPEYIENLKVIPVDISFDRFASIRAAVGWLGHSRPDICCAINRAAQVTEKTFEKKHIKELNQAISHVRRTADVKLKYEPLDRHSLHLRVYADASFASNDDNSSQLGFIVLLCDAVDRCHVLAYSSKKSRRVVRSIMAGEVYAFSCGFDNAFIIKHDLESVYRRRIPMTLLTDSKQMFDVITKASHTSEKRLMIDIAAAREAYNKGEISNVGLVLSEHNLADGLTKPGYSKSMDMMLRTGYDRNPVQQWIIRINTASRSVF